MPSNQLVAYNAPQNGYYAALFRGAQLAYQNRGAAWRAGRVARRYYDVAARRVDEAWRRRARQPPARPQTRSARSTRRVSKASRLPKYQGNRIANPSAKNRLLRKKQKTKYNPHVLSNKALTNLLIPQAKEHTEEAMPIFTVDSNKQGWQHFYQMTPSTVLEYYSKSRDLQNIDMVTKVTTSQIRDVKIRIGMMKDIYHITNNSSTEANLTFIEFRPKLLTDYEIEDTWEQDLTMKFQLRNTIEPTQVETVSKHKIGLHPFARGNTNTFRYFKHQKTRNVTLEPGQTIRYEHVTGGRTITLSDLNRGLVEAGTKPQRGPFCNELLVLMHGRPVEDSTTGTNHGFSAAEVQILRDRTVMYRAQLDQLGFQEYTNTATTYDPITIGEFMDDDGDVKVETKV